MYILLKTAKLAGTLQRINPKNKIMIQVLGLTEQEFKEMLSNAVHEALGTPNKAAEPQVEFIKGIHNLAKFLNVSAPRAQKLKREKVLSYFQDGRLVIFNKQTVLEEMAAYNQSKKRR